MTCRGKVVAVLFLFLFFLSLSSAQAYFVDSPHNESNGIYCYMCHNNTAWYWGDPNNNTGDIDVTIRNTVCLSCHDDPANLDLGNPAVKQAPVKTLHASSTTSLAKGTWSTECTDCHDPHTQPQLQWANSDSGSFWLADGFFDFTFGENPTFSAGDPDGQGYGVTTIGISFVGGQPGWTDPLTWGDKGGRMDATRALDNSRGLILVPNKATPADNYEVLNAVDLGGGNYRVKVKGQMTSAQEFVTFGVFYGQNLKVSVINPTDLLPRAVKFFQSDIIAGTYGGWIDNTPAITTPSGICQVCHTKTSLWTCVPEFSHYESTNCTICHDVLTAGAAAVTAPDHTNMVQNYTNCLGCHSATGFTVDPADPKVHNSCSSCHKPYGSLIDPATRPLVSAMPAGGVANNDGGGTCYTCHGNYFNSHTNIDHLTPVWVAPLPFCTTYCHTNTAGTTTTVPVSGADLELHDYCTNCHNTNGTLKDFSQADLQNPDRIIAMAPGDCSACHRTDYFESHIHGIGDPIQYPAVHSMEEPTGTNLTITQNCLSANCHAVTDSRGPYTTSGQVHEPRGCDTCHDLSGPNLDAQLRAAPYGDATVNSFGIDVNSDWECGECHYNHFDGHADRNANTGPFAHDVLMRGTDLAAGQPCNNCHKRGGTFSANPDFINEWAGSDGINALHGGCDTCHTSGRLGDTSAAGIQDIIQNGTLVGCLDCHASRNSAHIDHLLDDQDSDLTMALEESPQCTTCHNAGALPGSLTETNMIAIHAGSCGTCHQDLAGSGPLHDYSGTGGSINDNVDYETLNGGHGGTCTTCHIRYGNNFETGHQVGDHRNPALAASIIPYVAPSSTPTCTYNCHDGSSLSAILLNEHGDGSTSTCTNCHTDMLNDGSLRVALPSPANPNGDARNHVLGSISDCSTCHSVGLYPWGHDAGDNPTNYNHLGRVNLTTDNSCIACHTPADPAGNGVEDDLVLGLHSGNCGSCHNTGDGLILKAGWDGLGTAEFGPGDCKHCHSAPNGPMVSGHPAAHDNAPYEDVPTKETNPAIFGLCGTCHDAAGFADIATGHVGRTVVTGALGTPVDSVIDCGTCHNITSGAIGQAISWGRVDGGSTASCADCHLARLTPHP